MRLEYACGSTSWSLVLVIHYLTAWRVISKAYLFVKDNDFICLTTWHFREMKKVYFVFLYKRQYKTECNPKSDKDALYIKYHQNTVPNKIMSLIKQFIIQKPLATLELLLNYYTLFKMAQPQCVSTINDTDQHNFCCCCMVTHWV